jgi:hypothetical protein
MVAPNPVIVSGADAESLKRLYDDALEEMIAAIKKRIAAGAKPKRAGRPQLSVRDNGMPSISDEPFGGGNGPVEYSSVLEPPWGDDEARAKGKFGVVRLRLVNAVADRFSSRPGPGCRRDPAGVDHRNRRPLRDA